MGEIAGDIVGWARRAHALRTWPVVKGGDGALAKYAMDATGPSLKSASNQYQLSQKACARNAWARGAHPTVAQSG